MSTLETATGKTFDCDYFNPGNATKRLNLRVLNETIARVADVFYNPAETAELRCGSRYASGFTNLVYIIPEGNAIRVVLGKE